MLSLISNIDLHVIPFAAASLFLGVAFLYVAFMRGAPVLRITYLAVPLFALPWAMAMAFVSVTPDSEEAGELIRMGLSFTPLASCGAMLFAFELTRTMTRYRRLAGVAVALSLASAALCAETELVVHGAWMTPAGIYFGIAGPLAILHVGLIAVWIGIGCLVLYRSSQADPSEVRRRQYRATAWAWGTGALSVFDVALLYGIGWYPLSWFFLVVAALISLRALFSDELIRAAAVDLRAVHVLLFAFLVAIGVWSISSSLEPGWRGTVISTMATVLLFLFLRAGFALSRFLASSEEQRETPLDRAFEQYAGRVRSAESVSDIAGHTSELLLLALGCERVLMLEAAEGDYSWQRAGGDPLREQEMPDPRLLWWFTDHFRPILRDELSATRLGDTRVLLEQLFDAHRAEVVAPLVSGDEVVGLLAIGPLPRGRAVKPEELKLLRRVQEHATAAVMYSRMYQETHARVEVAKQVELAAAVQEAFVPGGAVQVHGRIELSGFYAPASRCGGDWWSAYPLDGGRLLLMIGDVTGHGVAAAMVTAAAKGCNDVALQLASDRLDPVVLLELLHRAVKRAGGDEFNMTCFVSILDPERRTVSFANAGHVVPYVCRTANGRVKLDVLVARGNPLGASDESRYTVHEQRLEPGDLLLWYTDGLVECTNRHGQQFGDRRFQRAIKGLAKDRPGVELVRDRVVREAFAFHEGQPAADDITLVVARVR